MQTVFLFSKIQTPRLQYITHQLLCDIIGFEIVFCNEKKAYEEGDGIKINYSDETILEKELHIIPQNLLFEKGIKEQILLENHIAAKIQNRENKTFDIFAASFYLLTRYEEYLPFEPDTHGRFSAKKSLAYRLDFLQKPLIQIWCNELKMSVLQNFSTAKDTRKYTFLFRPTYDIDQAFSYRNKGFFRTTVALLKDFWNKKRWQVLLQKANDPFDTFTYLDALHKKNNLQATYFFLLADWGKYDKNISVQNIDFQEIIQEVTGENEFGIHPSYASNSDFFILEKEKNRLENISKKTVKNSRQHYLKLHFPRTYQSLLRANITADYSMGYADEIGFRASIALPFHWYDIENELITDLIIYPFQAMDVTLKEYLKLSPEAALLALNKIKKETQNVDGQLITLWHNSSFGEDWKGWAEMYELFLNLE